MRGKLTIVLAALLAAWILPIAETAALTAGPPELPITWTAAGDSYSSGHGTEGETGNCRVNETGAWPRKAYDLVRVPLMVGTFRLAACSGAVLDDIWAQIGTTKNDLLTLSFGGNDVDFAGVIEKCITGSWGVAWGCPSDADVRRDIDRLRGKYLTILEALAHGRMKSGGHIVVAGYPAVVETPALWTGFADAVEMCNGINNTDAEMIRGWAGHLNATIGQAVKDINAKRPNGVTLTFLNINDGAGNPAGLSSADLYESPHGRHNLCGTDSWITGFAAHAGVTKGWHPDLDGHAATGRLVAALLKQLSWPSATRHTTTTTTTRPATTTTTARPATSSTQPPTTTQPPTGYAMRAPASARQGETITVTSVTKCPAVPAGWWGYVAGELRADTPGAGPAGPHNWASNGGPVATAADGSWTMTIQIPAPGPNHPLVTGPATLTALCGRIPNNNDVYQRVITARYTPLKVYVNPA